MFSYTSAKSEFNISNLIDLIKYRRSFSKENPSYFDPDGMIVFTGPQGSGKTLSAVKYVKNILKLYPNSILVTNLMIREFPIVTYDDWVSSHYRKSIRKNYNNLSESMQNEIYCDYLFCNRVFPFNNSDDLIRYSNYDEGVVFLIDEIQLYFNSLESKNINMDVMAQISQQRKQKKHIVCTSQVFGRLAKPLREQFNTVVNCKNYLGSFQVNKYVSNQDANTDASGMHVLGNVEHIQIFIHSPNDYKSYDTYYIIERNKFISGEEQNNIYELGIDQFSN